MAKKWTMVRVSEETALLLAVERRRMERGNEVGIYEVSELHGVISNDTVIRHLLDYRDGQRKRSKKSKAKKKASVADLRWTTAVEGDY